MKRMILTVCAITICALMVSCNGDRDQTRGELTGHEFVDLGLPSGTKWASANIGTDKDNDFGDYIAWGEVVMKNNFCWDTYRMNDKDSITKYSEADGLKSLQPIDDIATISWGKGWTIPTQKQFEELKRCCTWEWVEDDDVCGYNVKGQNGASIFLPAAGYYRKDKQKSLNEEGGYWTSNLSSDSYTMALGLIFDDGDIDSEEYDRCYGQSIRPVCMATIKEK